MRALQLPGMFPAEVPDAVIKRFTRLGDRVLDPFCGTGMLGLQAQLLGRVAWMSDGDRALLKLADALTNPAGLDEVVLRIHQLQLRRPTSFSSYAENFKPFFHADTFVEIANLRNSVAKAESGIDRFLGLLAASRLHGHTKSYLSAYSSPAFSLSPEKQEEVNRRRRVIPEYRALAPRLIKRAAELLEDGIPGRFYDVLPERRIYQGDARRLDWVETNSVDLYLSAPPLPGDGDFLGDQWLTKWFLDESDEQPFSLSSGGLVDWRNDLLRCLSEGLRVLRPGGYLALQLGRWEDNSEDGEGLVSLDDLIAEAAEHLRVAQKKFRIHELLVLKVSRDRALGLVGGNGAKREPRVLVMRAQSYG